MKPDLNTTEAGPVTASDDVQAGELNQVIADPELEISALKRRVEESDQINQSLLNHFDPLTDDHMNIQDNQHNDSFFGNIKEKEIVLDSTPVKDHHAGLLIPVTPLPEPPCTSQPTGSPNNSSPSMTHKLSSESKLPDIVRSPMQEAVVKQLTKLQDSMMARQLEHEKKVMELKCKIQEQERLKEIKLQNNAELEVRHPQHLQERVNKSKSQNVSFVEEISRLEKRSTELVCVVEGYEKALPTLLNQRESVKNKMADEVRSLLAERNTAMQHVSNMETALNDIHQKLDRCLKTIEDYKSSQGEKTESMRNRCSELEAAKERCFKLLSHATQRLEERNTERTLMMRNHDSEVAKIKVIQQQKELKIKSNNNTIEHKQKELKNMSKIYEDLLQRIN